MKGMDAWMENVLLEMGEGEGVCVWMKNILLEMGGGGVRGSRWMDRGCTIGNWGVGGGGVRGSQNLIQLDIMAMHKA